MTTCAAASAAAAAPLPASGTGSTDPTIDPATGVPYSQEAAYGAAGASAIDPATGLPYSAETGYGYGYGGTGYYGGGSGTPGPGSFTTNAEWAQYAEQYLTQNEGLGSGAVGAAIGRYVGGLRLTPEQVSVVEQAIAFAGLPPVAGNGGNPPGYLTDSGGGKKTTGPKRHVADGRQSLDEVARGRRTTPAHIEEVTRSAKEISRASLARFNTYVAHGTDKKMPAGLIYYTTD